jgi:hypothetical protein
MTLTFKYGTLVYKISAGRKIKSVAKNFNLKILE